MPDDPRPLTEGDLTALRGRHEPFADAVFSSIRYCETCRKTDDLVRWPCDVALALATLDAALAERDAQRTKRMELEREAAALHIDRDEARETARLVGLDRDQALAERDEWRRKHSDTFVAMLDAAATDLGKLGAGLVSG